MFGYAGYLGILIPLLQLWGNTGGTCVFLSSDLPNHRSHLTDWGSPLPPALAAPLQPFCTAAVSIRVVRESILSSALIAGSLCLPPLSNRTGSRPDPNGAKWVNLILIWTSQQQQACFSLWALTCHMVTTGHRESHLDFPADFD